MLVGRPGLVVLLTAWLLVTGVPRVGVALPVEPVQRDVGGPSAAGDPSAGAATSSAGAATSTAEGARAQVTTGTVPRTQGVQRQGSVVAVFEDPADPLIVIAVDRGAADSGFITVRLRCGSLCPSIRLGDYVVVEGQRRSEAVLDAVEVWVATP